MYVLKAVAVSLQDLWLMMGRLFFELPFSRTHELEADAIGVMLCAKACYNPAAAMKVINHMLRALLSLCQSPMSEIVTPSIAVGASSRCSSAWRRR